MLSVSRNQTYLIAGLEVWNGGGTADNCRGEQLGRHGAVVLPEHTEWFIEGYYSEGERK